MKSSHRRRCSDSIRTFLTGREALQDDENASEYRQDDTETTAAAKAEGATLEALMMTPIMWLNFAITALCFGVGGGAPGVTVAFL